MNYKIAPEVFFLVEKGSVVLWNCITHEQYLIDEQHFSEVLTVSKDGVPKSKNIFDVLKDVGVIVKEEVEPLWGWDILSRIFHIGTKNVPCEEIINDPDIFSYNYIEQCQQIEDAAPNLFQEKNTLIIDLPLPDINLQNSTLSSALLNRKTSRSFNGEPTTIETLSNLLFASFGLIHGEWNEIEHAGLKIAGIRKSSPSSGGLHAEEAYLTVFNVIGLESGLYYYRPQDHKLNLLMLGDFENKVIDYNHNQFYSKGLSFGVYLTARLDKYWWKYPHSRSYRTMLLDIGHSSQTFLLCATALGLNTWLTAAFKDSEVESFLSINGYEESVMMYVGAGYGKPLAFDKGFLPK